MLAYRNLLPIILVISAIGGIGAAIAQVDPAYAFPSMEATTGLHYGNNQISSQEYSKSDPFSSKTHAPYESYAGDADSKGLNTVEKGQTESAADAISKSPISTTAILHESLATHEGRNLGMHKSVNEEMGLADSKAKRSTKVLVEDIGVSEALPVAAQALKNLTDSLMFADTNVRAFSRKMEFSPSSDGREAGSLTNNLILQALQGFNKHLFPGFDDTNPTGIFKVAKGTLYGVTNQRWINLAPAKMPIAYYSASVTTLSAGDGSASSNPESNSGSNIGSEHSYSDSDNSATDEVPESGTDVILLEFSAKVVEGIHAYTFDTRFYPSGNWVSGGSWA